MVPLRRPTLLAAAFAALLPGWQAAAAPHFHRHTETGHFPAPPPGASDGYVDSTPPLWDNLGTLSYPITTKNRQAQRYFDQGLRLSYAFNHLEAQRAFRMAQKLDPDCALCYWGEALVLGPNINAPMEASAVAPAWAAVTRAQGLAKHATPRERGLIDALAKRYSQHATADRRILDAAYAEAMGKLVARFPRDTEIAVLYVESLMDLTPWDYWADGGHKPKRRTRNILALLERVLARNPNHPGAIHFYIHMTEASDRPRRAEPYARRLAALMPGAGHLVHMPGHLYYRLGRYREALEANRAAIAADEAYLRETGARGIYAQGYYPHNLHFLLVSAQMAGDGATALPSADKLLGLVDTEIMRKVPWLQPIKAASYFAHAQFSSRGEVWKLPDPGTEFPYIQGAWRYARGIAAAASGNLSEAQAERNSLETIAKTSDFTALAAAGVPAAAVLGIAEQVLTARIARLQGNGPAAVDAFVRAAEAQEKLSYMEPPYWYYPVRRSLGAQKLLAGDARGAVREFQAALRASPDDAWTLLGLAEAQRRSGNAVGAARTEERIRRAYGFPGERVDLSRL